MNSSRSDCLGLVESLRSDGQLLHTSLETPSRGLLVRNAGGAIDCRSLAIHDSHGRTSRTAGDTVPARAGLLESAGVLKSGDGGPIAYLARLRGARLAVGHETHPFWPTLPDVTSIAGAIRLMSQLWQVIAAMSIPRPRATTT